MNTKADCIAKFHDPQLQARHLRLLHALKEQGIQATCGDDDRWMVTLPHSLPFRGWISMQELEPPLDELVILRTLRGTVFEGFRSQFHYQDRECRLHSANDFSHWMRKPE